jgi:hypothetical protein
LLLLLNAPSQLTAHVDPEPLLLSAVDASAATALAAPAAKHLLLLLLNAPSQLAAPEPPLPLLRL